MIDFKKPLHTVLLKLDYPGYLIYKQLSRDKKKHERGQLTFFWTQKKYIFPEMLFGITFA